MTTFIFVLVWVVAGLGLLLIAMSGGPSGASQRFMSQTRASRRVATVLFAIAFVVLGALVPAAVISAEKDKDDIPEANVSDLTESEMHGRELFGQRCANCHTLKASNAIAEVGPNLDTLRPNKEVVTERHRGGPRRGQRPDGGRAVHGRGRRRRRQLRGEGRRRHAAGGRVGRRVRRLSLNPG